MTDPTPAAMAVEVDPASLAGRQRGWTLPALLLVLLTCLPSLLIELGGRDSTHTMENVALVTSQETWQRCAEGEGRAWLMTSNDSQPRVEKPPLLAWLSFLVWSDLDPSDAPPSLLVWRARLVSVSMGLVLLASVFWLGLSLGDLRLAILAALVASSVFFLQRQARTASYDIHYVSWLTLAVASSVWAMRPGGSAPALARRIIGWSVAGLALAASVMSKNPLPVALMVLLAGSAIVALPVRRNQAAIGLLWSVWIVVLLCGPWYLYALIEHDDAFRTLANEFRQPRRVRDAQAWYYYAGLLALVAPWSLWLVAGLVHPFMPVARGCRRPRLAPWVWFAILLIVFSLPAAKQQRYILPVIPAAALLIARVFVDHDSMARSGRRDRGATPLIWAHWVILLLMSVCLGPFLALQEPLLARFARWREAARAELLEAGRASGLIWDWISGDDLPTEAVVGSIQWPAALAVGAVLTALAIWGLVEHRRWRPMRAGLIGVAWTLLLLGVYWDCYAAAPSAVHPIRQPVEAFAQRIGDAPLRSLRLTTRDRTKYKVNEEFRFYFGRRIPHVTEESLAAYLQSEADILYVLAKDEPLYRGLMEARGLADEGPVLVDVDEHQRLWSCRRRAPISP